MVRKGSFTVELVDATTNLPFKEHTKQEEDASVYVEVEPNAQYWIRVQSHANNNDDDPYHKCELQVDGKDLGFAFHLQAGVARNVGLENKNKTIVTKRAFQVQSLQEDNGGQNNNPFWIGTIKARFYHATKVDKMYSEYSVREYECDWGGGKAPAACVDGQKSLSSTPGTITKTRARRPHGNHYSRGELLETITLHYCTTVGLIYVKVLPQPPNWDYHRLKFPIKDNPTPLDPTLAAIQPTIKTVTVAIDGNIKEVLPVTMFDLSHLDDSVDNDKTQVAVNNHPHEQADIPSNTLPTDGSTVTDDSSIGSPDASPQKQQVQQVVDPKKYTPHCHPNNWDKSFCEIDQDESCNLGATTTTRTLDRISRSRKRRLVQHCDWSSDDNDNNSSNY